MLQMVVKEQNTLILNISQIWGQVFPFLIQNLQMCNEGNLKMFTMVILLIQFFGELACHVQIVEFYGILIWFKL